MEALNQDGGSPSQASQMMMQMMTQMSEELRALRAERETDREETRNQIRAIQSAIATPALTPQPLEPLNTAKPEPQRSSSPERPSIKRKPILPDPPRFDGTRRKFRAWQLEMQSKLRVDDPALGEPSDQFAYIYSRLAETPQATAAAFFEKGGSNQQFEPSEFMTYLASCYGDPNIEQRALSRLETMRQGDKESFASFLPKFERELADSGGASWADSVRINALKRVVNQELRSHLAGQLSLPKTYPSFVNALQSLGANLEELRFYNRKLGNQQEQRRGPSPNQEQPRQRSPPSKEASDQMDWEPTKVRRYRSKLPDRRKCYRCGEVGHIIAHCTQHQRSRQDSEEARKPKRKTRAAGSKPRKKRDQDLSDEDEASSLSEAASAEESENE